MQTLNQIKNRLVGYLNSHAQINQVVYGDNYKFAADRNLKYPVANVEWVESNVSGRLIGHTFRIIFADRTNPNIDAIDDDIDSDMLLIADDFFSWLQDQEGFIFTKSSQIVKLTDEYGDRISGIRFRIILSTVRRANDCETPKELPPVVPIVNNTAIFSGDILSMVAEYPATLQSQTVTSINGTTTLVNITMPWLGGANFEDEYTVPEGLTLIDSFTYSNLYWNLEVSYVAANNLVFDFHLI